MSSPTNEITTGTSLDGGSWQWRDGYLPDSHLLLFPEIPNPTDFDTLRHEHSVAVKGLFNALVIPRVTMVEVDPISLPTYSGPYDLYPRWQIDSPIKGGDGDSHVFIYGISRRLLESMTFSGLPPQELLDAWALEDDPDEFDDQHDLWMENPEDEL
jgi:hypothetical protein